MNNNEYALITGASRGIGASIAKQLAKDGYNILLNYKSNDSKALEIADEIKNIGRECELLKFDVSNFEDVSKHLSEYKKNIKIKILVNNASHPVMKSFNETTEEDWNSIMAVVLGGFYNLTSNIIPSMIENNCGKIINITSIGAFIANGSIAYVTAKSGLVGATRALANEIKKTGITVNAIAAGPINTDFLPDELRKEICSKADFKIGEPQDIADIVSFLCSDKANYINGQVIHVNGGMYI